MNIYVEFSGKDGLTAKVGGGQGGATLLNSMVNYVDHVGSVGDSCILDAAVPSVPGSTVKIREVFNLDAANDMDLFPDVGEEFDVQGTGLIGVNTPISIGAGNGRKFICFTAGIWRTL